MAKTIGFRKRFPHAGIFLVIAVALAIPLTVWSLNNVSTQTEQHAATICASGAGVTTKKCTGTGKYAATSITCGKTYCDGSNGCSYHSWNCSTTSTGYPVCGVQYTHTNSGSCGYTAPTPTATSTLVPPTCFNYGGTCTSSSLCVAEGYGTISGPTGCSIGQVCCKLHPPTPTTTPISCASVGGVCTSKTLCNAEGGSGVVGNPTDCVATSPDYLCCKFPITPTITPTCASQGGTCYNSFSCPSGTTLLQQKCTVSGSTSSGICCK